jgi:hypothetical protein
MLCSAVLRGAFVSQVLARDFDPKASLNQIYMPTRKDVKILFYLSLLRIHTAKMASRVSTIRRAGIPAVAP